LNKPQLEITIDRERAAGLGVSVTDMAARLKLFGAGW
jgi:multidrug efflux pump subunit AcrB